MSYVKAEEVLPVELLEEIQKHVQGKILYIPKADGIKKSWGECTGSREYLNQRNIIICEKFDSGSKIEDLAKDFYLSVHSIKRIVYSSKAYK